MKKTISFWARKTVTRPVKVNFRRASGERVSFWARKKITKPVRVRFKTK